MSVATKFSLSGKSVLITGGTGPFGRKCVEVLLAHHDVQRIAILSRDEQAQFDMQQRFASPKLRFFIGDVRDRDRLRRTFAGVDIVIHAAALRQVPTADQNPFEVIKTNVIGAENVVDAALDEGVEKVIALSGDNAASPVTLSGAAKLCSDKLFIASNNYAGNRRTRFSVVRYSSVAFSRTHVATQIAQKRATGLVPLADQRMTRFWITFDQCVDLVTGSLERMYGGEVYVPKAPSFNVADLAAVLAPECKTEVTGLRADDKLHDLLITADDARNTVELHDRYVILPAFDVFATAQYAQNMRLADGVRYGSDTNKQWLTKEALAAVVARAQQPT